MADMLADGMKWLDGQLKDNASTDVLYSRGPDSVTIAATFGNQLLKLDDGAGGIRMEWTDLDFLFSAKDLVIAGETITPRRGDMVMVSRDDANQYYEVTPYDGDPPWRYSDPYHNRIRVHTKHVEIEAYG